VASLLGSVIPANSKMVRRSRQFPAIAPGSRLRLVGLVRILSSSRCWDRCPDRGGSFAPSELDCLRVLSHGLRRGLRSFAGQPGGDHSSFLFRRNGPQHKVHALRNRQCVGIRRAIRLTDGRAGRIPRALARSGPVRVMVSSAIVFRTTAPLVVLGARAEVLMAEAGRVVMSKLGFAAYGFAGSLRRRRGRRRRR